MSFVGKYQNSIDSKSRLIIPAKFREELGGRCVIAQSLDKCLTISPEAEWENFLQELKTLPRSNPEARMIRRYFNQSAARCDVDKQGRVTIPQDLKDYAGITKDLVTIGNIDNIEVWSKEHWEKDAFAQAGEDMTASDINASEIAAALEKFGF
jgi:MraZ protein